MKTTTRRSSRRPKLRIVSPDRTTRHPVAIRFHEERVVLGEVITFDEWNLIPTRLQPSGKALIPGIGWIVCSLLIGSALVEQYSAEIEHAEDASHLEYEMRYPQVD